MKHIYVYTTASYQSKNWYKIGETINNPQNRIQSQDNASNPEPLIFVSSWEVPNYVTDKKVHKKLENFGFLKIRREWFELSKKPKEDVISAISEITPIVCISEVDNTPAFLSNIKVLNYTDLWWFKKR